ncbi:class I SAM-dependent methyltransferase [Hydrogenivirga sp.]
MRAFQELWEDLRKEGRNVSRYPYEKVIRFVMRYHPRDRERRDIKVLEVGCGAGNNLWALAMEGFDVYGIDGSPTAIQLAETLFDRFGLKGHLYTQDFIEHYPFPDEHFDLIIDRAALTCVSTDHVREALSEVYRVLKRGGYLFFNPYSKKHFSYIGSKDKGDNSFVLVKAGSIKGTGYVCFYDENDIHGLFNQDMWEFKEMIECVCEDKMDKDNTQAHWEVILKKK